MPMISGGPTVTHTETRQLPSLVRGVGDGDLPVRPRRDVERDVPVGVHHRRRQVGQQRPGAVGDPTLGHAVEVEAHTGAPLDATSPPIAVAQRPGSRPMSPRHAATAMTLGIEALIEQRDVDQALCPLGQPRGSLEDRRQRRTDRHRLSGRPPVERAELGARVEAREAVGPCPDAGGDQRQPPIGFLRLHRPVDPEREHAAHDVVRSRPFDASHQRPPDWRVRTVGRRTVTAAAGAAMCRTTIIEEPGHPPASRPGSRRSACCPRRNLT